MELSFLKTRGNREEAGLSLVRYEHIYQAVKEEHEEHHYPIQALCKLGGVSRAAYYKWLNHEVSENEQKNQQIAELIEKFIVDCRIKAIAEFGMNWNATMELA